MPPRHHLYHADAGASSMAYHIKLGSVDADQSLAAENFAIPALDHLSDILPGLDLACHVLREAADLRTGLLLIGPKAAGKTTAIDRAIRLFREEEQRKLQEMPEQYRERRVLYTHGLAAKSARELLVALLKHVSPGLRERQHGSRKSDDQLREELVHGLLNKGYAVLVLDEAEYLVEHGFDTLRKIMADAATADPRRVIADGNAEGYRAAGVGIVLVGTDKVADLVRQNADAGLRWSACHQVPLLPPDAAGSVYRAIFPGFERHIATVGEDAWAEFMATHVTRGRAMPIGVLAMHARRYFTLLSDASLGTAEEFRTREATPFAREVFLATLTMTEWPQEIAAQRRRNG